MSNMWNTSADDGHWTRASNGICGNHFKQGGDGVKPQPAYASRQQKQKHIPMREQPAEWQRRAKRRVSEQTSAVSKVSSDFYVEFQLKS
jgi:hypothetical protein